MSYAKAKRAAQRQASANAVHPMKVGKVMHEFKAGTLMSSSGKKVTSRKQALAISMSEAGMSKKRRKR